MAKPQKRRVEGGRVTPKGTRPDDINRNRTVAPPASKVKGPSPMWVPVLMFSFFAAGLIIIFLNYTAVLPGATDNWYTLGGLGLILAGIITATQYR
ncbi:MAG: hypothetical protein HKN26_12220 [Acidimicrobiales bacterium]|nr:hypothetical protein [Acidimicrobiales bacterium]